MSAPDIGEGHEDRCGGLTRAGKPCRMPKGYGTDHPGFGSCKHHTGSTPNGRKAAERERLEHVERQIAARLSDVPCGDITDPLAAFARIVARAAQLQEFLYERIDELGTALRYRDAKDGEQLRSEVALYERALERCGKLLAEWVKLGLDERRVRVEEEQSRLLLEYVRAVFADVGVDPHAPETEVAMRRHLHVLEGGRAA